MKNRIQGRTIGGMAFMVIIATLTQSVGYAPSVAQTWQPPEPSPEERDWLKMNSGEWLWGDLKSLRDKNLEFDSEEFDLQKIDWDDVAEFRSARVLTYRFEEAGVFTGTATVREGIVRIQTDTGVRELPRDDLIMILEGTQRERDFWSAKATLGFVGRSGNTDQADINTSLRIRRQSPKSRWDTKYNGNLGEVSGEQNINNQNFVTGLDMLVKAGFFVTPGVVNLFHDKFQNIDLRTSAAAGVGYVIIRGGDVDWLASLSAGYIHTKFISVQEGEDDVEGSFAVIPATDFEWDITGDIEFSFDYNLQLPLPETRNSFQHAAGTLSFDIWGDIFDLDFSLTWDRVESPKPDADGNVPERDDFRTNIGIGLDI